MRRSQDYAVYVATEIDRWIFWGTLLGFNIGELGCLAAWRAGGAWLPGRRAAIAVRGLLVLNERAGVGFVSGCS
jgi:hypothetical protein